MNQSNLNAEKPMQTERKTLVPEDIANLIAEVMSNGRLQHIIRYYRTLSPHKQRQLHRIVRAMLG